MRKSRSLSSTLRSDSIASCASTVLFAGDELSSPRTPSKGALAAPAAVAAASADLTAADVSAGLEEMDPSEREYLLRLLFERFCTHGKDREQAPHKQIALRSFGPARYGTLVHTLREDVRLHESRLAAKSRSPPFVFSDFAAAPKSARSAVQGGAKLVAFNCSARRSAIFVAASFDLATACKLANSDRILAPARQVVDIMDIMWMWM